MKAFLKYTGIEGQSKTETPKTADGKTADVKTTDVKVNVLDGIVSVNSLFTIAVFLGLTFSPAQQSIETNSRCVADASMTRQLVLFEVISFSLFLFSSIVAQGLKTAIVVLNGKDKEQSSSAAINLRLLHTCIVFCALGSILGCVALIYSMILVIEIRLGKFKCIKGDTIAAAVSLFLVLFGIVVYIGLGVYASMKTVGGRAARRGLPAAGGLIVEAGGRIVAAGHEVAAAGHEVAAAGHEVAAAAAGS